MDFNELENLLHYILNDLGIDFALRLDSDFSLTVKTKNKLIQFTSIKKGKIVSFLKPRSTVDILHLYISNKFLKEHIVDLIKLYQKIEDKPLGNANVSDYKYFEEEYQIKLNARDTRTGDSILTHGYRINELVSISYDKRHFNKNRWEETDMLYTVIKKMEDYPYHKKFY